MRETPDPERGLPILKPTQCKTGTHMFVSYGRTDPPEKELTKPDARCDCGMFRFSDLSNAGVAS